MDVNEESVAPWNLPDRAEEEDARSSGGMSEVTTATGCAVSRRRARIFVGQAVYISTTVGSHPAQLGGGAEHSYQKREVLKEVIYTYLVRKVQCDDGGLPLPYDFLHWFRSVGAHRQYFRNSVLYPLS
jgi:hypothetical protein